MMKTCPTCGKPVTLPNLTNVCAGAQNPGYFVISPGQAVTVTISPPACAPHPTFTIYKWPQ